jgi:RNA polymerase sigma-70 factor (ECF subfamily)
VQETFLAAIQSFEKFEGKSNPKTWLFSILNNKINDYHRWHYKNPTASVQQQSEERTHSLFETLFDEDKQWEIAERPKAWSDDEENILDDAAFHQVLQNCLSKLPSNWFSAIQLKYMEEKNGDVICQELQISPTNFWQILHRAKLQLRKCLGTNWFKN